MDNLPLSRKTSFGSGELSRSNRCTLDPAIIRTKRTLNASNLSASYLGESCSSSHPVRSGQIGVIRANYISFNLNNGSSLDRDSAPRGFASICSGAGICRVLASGERPTRFNFTSVEHFDRKVCKSCPHSFYERGKGFSAYSWICVGIAKRAVFVKAPTSASASRPFQVSW